ncbi:MurR/RpiR family transcriptional regulator [Paenibacillus sp. J2TS4]|uniref:MurR/RpiR family transcriptional regulator n=1 Tax=Paenibacillus sp. J2TS4 TaxID=2807194 RepID=UPI001BCDD060|nr:MurR/RpiR family transcriptional regulator [Paenibacillus sp. J2TS4]
MNKMSELNNSLLMINSIYSSLTKSEKKVADTVLKDPEAAVFFTITDLAEKADVGETSVIRLCRKLGFKGYQEFKLSIVQDLATPAEQIHGEIEENDNTETVAKKITSQNTQALNNALSLLNEQHLVKIVDAMIAADSIFFYGVGSSGVTAMDAKYRFMRLGFQVDAIMDSHMMAMNASLAGKNDVVGVISTSGSTKDVVDAVTIAKASGAFIFCITNHAKSPVTQQADAVLLGTSRETPLQGGAFSSKLSQIHLLDILSTVIALRQKDKTYAALEKTAKAVSDKLY